MVNISMMSSMYQMQQEQYAKELKFKKLEDAYKNQAKELNEARAELRQEKKNNVELIKLVEKLDKKVTVKEQTSDRFELV